MPDWFEKDKEKRNQSGPEGDEPQQNGAADAERADLADTLPSKRDQIGKEVPVNEAASKQIAKLHEKLDALAERFAKGNINRVQFQELFSYYQGKIHELETYLSYFPQSQDWKNIVNEGQSILIRRRYAAKLNGFSIIDHRNGMPLRTIGDFGLDPALFVPMLYAYQSATKEIFGSPVRLTQIEGGKYLVFISGETTTTLALFSTEPSQEQMKTLEQVHKVFEAANVRRLKKSPVDPASLVCPHEYFLQHSL
jgi:hypothetical protein